MAELDKVIGGLEFCKQYGRLGGHDCNGHYERYTEDGQALALVGEYRSKCPYGKCTTGCVVTLTSDAYELLNEYKAIKESISDGIHETAKMFRRTAGDNDIPLKW